MKDRQISSSAKDVMRFAAYIWKPQKARFPFLLGGMGIAAIADTVFPVMTGRMVSIITETEGGHGWSRALMTAFCLFIALELFYHSIRNATMMLWCRVAVQSIYKVVTDSFTKVQKFSTDWHANAFAGGTVRKITRGMWAFDRFEDTVFIFLYPTAIVLCSTITLMFVRWQLMGWVTLGAATLYIGFSIWAALTINRPKFQVSAEADTKIGATLADAVTGNAAVKAFGREADEDRHFRDVADRWWTVSVHAWRTATMTDLFRRYLALLMMAVMVGTAVHLWTTGQAKAADVVYVLTAYIVLSAYLRNIGEQISNLMKAMAEMEDVIGFWRMKEDVQDANGADTLTVSRGEIAIDRIRFAYQSKTDPIYDDFSLTIRPGEKVALVGPSGSGKSTFVKLVQRLYDVQGGAIRIDGQDIKGVTQESLRKAIALVPQEPILFHRSIATNIAYGRPDATHDEIVTAARKAFAHDFIERLPLGYETLVGERGVKLSGGERQRIAIARAILADCPILILDEATSSLDSESEHYIQKAMEALLEGRTSITIAHRLATIRSVDRILVFNDGRVVEQGSHAALLENPDSLYKKLYDMQALDLVGAA